MKYFYFTIIGYITLIHLFSFFYVVNVIRSGFYYTTLVAFIMSYFLILLSIIIYIKNVGIISVKNYLMFFVLIIFPITFFFYLPLIFTKEIISGIGIIFPAFSEIFLFISYQPTYLLMILSQVFISLFISLSVYFYSRKKKF